MSNKAKSIYFLIFAVLYLFYTALIAKHGLHFTNVAGTIGLILLAVYFYLKNKKQNNN